MCIQISDDDTLRAVILLSRFVEGGVSALLVTILIRLRVEIPIPRDPYTNAYSGETFQLSLA